MLLVSYQETILQQHWNRQNINNTTIALLSTRRSWGNLQYNTYTSNDKKPSTETFSYQFTRTLENINKIEEN